MAKRKVSGSVIETQEAVFAVMRKVARARKELQALLREYARVTAKHKEQIRQSLQSELHSEREAAESIARWWEVELPKKGASHG